VFGGGAGGGGGAAPFRVGVAAARAGFLAVAMMVLNWVLVSIGKGVSGAGYRHTR